MATLTETINGVNKKGFTEDSRAVDGFIQTMKSKKKYFPEDLTIVESYWFEGMTNPSDEIH